MGDGCVDDINAAIADLIIFIKIFSRVGEW